LASLNDELVAWSKWLGFWPPSEWAALFALIGAALIGVGILWLKRPEPADEPKRRGLTAHGSDVNIGSATFKNQDEAMNVKKSRLDIGKLDVK
jgi:hypothetical protein